MNFGLRHWTTLLLFIWLSYDTNAQRFPVSATIQILPPYTPYLSDYVSPGQDHIRITLINLDLKEPSIPVKLRIHIEGQGYSFTSGKNVATIPITLQANTPITLTNEDLRPYIAPGTSLIQSLKTNTSNTSKLNEGAYQFCVEVYHYIRDETPISDMACTVAFLQELDPPVIVAPAFDVIPGNPQAIMIAWHTQHFGGFPVDYELSLYEKIPGMGDQAIVDFTAPIFRQTTPGLAYLYRTDDPPLVIGKTYLVRVQVRDALGRNLFKNHGYSTIAHFQYGRSCDPPLITEAKLFPDGHAHISWTTESNHGNQEIRYRYHDDPNWTVSSVTSALQHLSTSAFHQYAIPITKSSGPLQVQIGASCYSTIAVESAIESIKLDRKSLPRGFYSCGMESSVLDSASTTLINDLNNDDTISANGYLVIIKSANKSGDTYSGECGVMIPMFKGAIIKGHFYDVKVNEDYMMIAGNIKLESAGVQLLSDKYLDLLDGLIETAKTAHDIFSQATFQSAIEYLRPYLGMFLNDSLKDKLQLAIDNLDHASTPEEQLKAQEQLTEVLKDIADAIKLLYDAPYQINFFADKNQRYGFDKFDPSRYRDLVNNYDKLSIAKKEYYVPFKSLEASKGDLLLAKPEVESTDQILFILEDSTEVPATKLTDGSYQLTLPPFPSKGEYNLYAVIKDANPTDSTHDEHIAGQCKIVVYEPQKNNVILIPINGAKAPNEKSIQDQLNRIYAPVVSQWNVTTQENLDVPGFDNTLDSISTGLLSTYTTEMRSIIKSYIAKYQDDTNSYHLFVVNGTAEQGLLGFMPKKRAYGFITYTDATTIAHELGHGAFRLNHLFEDYNDLRSRTDNLMDYNTPQGSELLHYQWEEVHHPAPMVGWLQGDDEGELVASLILKCLIASSLDFTFYYAGNYLSEYFEDSTSVKPSFFEFNKITTLPNFSWPEVLTSMGISCVASNLPKFLSTKSSQQMALGLSALGGTAMGFATELAKQYDIAYLFLSQKKPDPSFSEILSTINWGAIIYNSAFNGVITATTTWLTTHKKYDALIEKIKNKVGISDIVKDADKIIDFLKYGSRIKFFTNEQIEKYARLSTQQNDKIKVMLGMYDKGASTSYINKAGNDFTFFSMGDLWDEASYLVDKNNDEIWRINKQFIDNQILLKKEFWFSHDPFSPKNEQFFAREVNYLIDLGVKDFVKLGDIWKAIW